MIEDLPFDDLKPADTELSRRIFTSLFANSNLPDADGSAPAGPSIQQIRDSQDCGHLVEGYRILTKTWNSARPTVVRARHWLICTST